LKEALGCGAACLEPASGPGSGRSAMAMAMMEIGIMRVLVPHRFVSMPV